MLFALARKNKLAKKAKRGLVFVLAEVWLDLEALNIDIQSFSTQFRYKY